MLWILFPVNLYIFNLCMHIHAFLWTILIVQCGFSNTYYYYFLLLYCQLTWADEPASIYLYYI